MDFLLLEKHIQAGKRSRGAPAYMADGSAVIEFNLLEERMKKRERLKQVMKCNTLILKSMRHSLNQDVRIGKRSCKA